MKSIEHTRAFEMAVPIAVLFPMFSPEGEKRWVPGWDYENIMGHAELCEDYVFVTKTHDHRTTDAIWTVKKYDPASSIIEFYKIEPEDKIGVIRVLCTSLTSERTEVQVTYKYIALSALGEHFVADFDEQAYEKFIGEWQTLLTDYFESG